MTISQDQQAAMRRMFYADRHTVNAIAEHFRVHHSTVTRALNQDYCRSKKGVWPVLLDAYRAYIDQLLEKYPKITATKIYDRLLERGFKGSCSTVRRYVGRIRPTRSRAYVPIQVFAGEEGQVDWAHAGQMLVGTATRKLYCFVMTLSWSRASWVEFTFDVEVETLLRCHSRAFEYFGGIPHKVLYDNMKTVVLARHGDIIQFNPAFLEYSSHYCFEPRICDPYQPQQKGRVERFIRYLRDSFLNEQSFDSFGRASERVQAWVGRASARPWPDGAHQTVGQCLDQERPKLLPLGSLLSPQGHRTVRSGRTPVIRFDLNQYTIDPRFVRRPLSLRYDHHQVVLYDGDELAARHHRCWGRDEMIRDPEHIEATFALASKGQSQALGRDLLLRDIPRVREIFEHCQATDVPLPRVERILFDLRSTYGSSVLRDAIDHCVRRGCPTPEAIRLAIHTSRDQQRTAQVPLRLPDRPGVADLEITSHNLSDYDDI